MPNVVINYDNVRIAPVSNQYGIRRSPTRINKVKLEGHRLMVQFMLLLHFPSGRTHIPDLSRRLTALSCSRYCVEFEILKASKACRKEVNYGALKEGERVCVRCESEALHQNLGWRCQGHGVEGRITRFSALSAPHCHGKWLRAQAEVDRSCTARTCKAESAFIFV
ncbi:hypothetical protein BDFB_007544 [Asbolus verrucosus]|uniref:SBSPON-like C-terminal domain-containing protein n=1 Tax=Asbolus verrucosus TaxID=1661398 RepID=A0A482VQT3_ASBVE|nr:hypothetical protein BDFB_007544 [Asbolus verrucosus]